jgi:hypothetical protein
MYAHDTANFVLACQLDPKDSKVMDAVKKFCNSSAGSGKKIEAEFLAAVGVEDLPQLLKDYRNQIKVAMNRDVHDNPSIVEKLRANGITNARDILCKTHFLINTYMERQDMDRVQQVLQKHPISIISLEMDGLAVMSDVMSPHEMLQLCNAADTSSTWAWKPYPSTDELMELLVEQNDLDLSAWTEKDDEWLKAYNVEVPALPVEPPALQMEEEEAKTFFAETRKNSILILLMKGT